MKYLEVIKLSNYVAYHVHSDYSLLDSCTHFEDYVDRAVELGQKAIGSTEHGRPIGWMRKQMYCESKGIKFLWGVEAYLTEKIGEEKIRDNYHTVLIARNKQGREEINKLIMASTDANHFYYKNRITFDEFLGISDNVIKISACLASPLNKYEGDNKIYEKLARHYDFYEIQPHNNIDQIKYNQRLLFMSEQYGKPLIAGTDTHSLNQYKAECRKILLASKKIEFAQEDEFDLTYKSYDELAEMFRVQDAIPENKWREAIENTNRLADMVEDVPIDPSIKYPILYGSAEADRERWFARIDDMLAQKVAAGIIPPERLDQVRANIEDEKKVFTKIGMCGFMLIMSELICWCRDNDIPVGPGRGSVCGSTIAYITDITDVDPTIWKTVASRFANEDRVEIGDIDIDVIDTDRPRIFEYIINRFGEAYTARVPSYGTIADKAAIDDIGRALASQWQKEHPDTNLQECPYSLKKVDDIKKQYSVDPDGTKTKYKNLFYYYDGLVGTKVSQSVHPAGIVISPITLTDNFGTFYKDDMSCLEIDMDEIHDGAGLAKFDFLILRNVAIIADTCKLVGIPYPRAHEINWDEPEVWEDMRRNTTAIFQMESPYAGDSLRKFKPHNIFGMSLVTACIRPSGASYRDDLLGHKQHHNPSKLIDDLLADNNGYLVYQEDVIKFLTEICGFSGSEADTVRRGIARKKPEILEKAMPKILDGYCAKSDKSREEAEAEAKEFIKIIEDASSYMFGWSCARTL